MKENHMIKIVVKVGEKELPYEFSEIWQVEWLIKFLNWYLGLPEEGLTKRAVDFLSRLASWFIVSRDLQNR